MSKSKVYVQDIGEVDAGVQYLINVITLMDLCGKGGTIAFKIYARKRKAKILAISSLR